MLPINNSNSENVLSFVRSNKIDKVVGIFNLSAEQQTVRLLDSMLFEGTYITFSSGKKQILEGESEFTLAPWESIVLIQP